MTKSSPKSPDRPLTPHELLRIGSALQPYGYKWFGKTHELWIAMTATPPHEVGIVTNVRSTAEAAVSGPGKLKFALYGPFQAPAESERYLDELNPTDHWDCGGQQLGASPEYPAGEHPSLADVTGMTLSVTWKNSRGVRTVTRFDVNHRADAIFLSQAAREAFAYPRYLSSFGPKYVKKLRKGFKDREE